MLNRNLESVNKGVDKYIVFFFSVSAFLMLNPYFIWDTYLGFLASRIILTFFYGWSLILFFISFVHTYKASLKNVYIYLVFFVYVTFIVVASPSSLGLIMLMLLILSFILIEDNLKIDIFEKFCNIYVIFMILPIITYILFMLFGTYIFGYSHVLPVNTIKSYGYNISLLSVFPNYFGVKNTRFCGVFDEPGVVGTVSALILISGVYRFNQLRYYVILFTGIISMSFAFFIIVALFCIINIIAIIKFFLKKPLYSIVLFILLVMILIYVLDKNPTYMFRFTTIFDGGNIAKLDNRNLACGDQAFNNVISSSSVFFGYGADYLASINCLGGASLKNTVISYGIVPVFLLLYTFYMIMLQGIGGLKDRIYIVGVFVIFLLCFYQRPFLSLMYISFCYYVSYRYAGITKVLSDD